MEQIGEGDMGLVFVSEVRLLHLETLEEIATLTAPEPGLIVSLDFGPDGRQLFVSVATRCMPGNWTHCVGGYGTSDWTGR